MDLLGGAISVTGITFLVLMSFDVIFLGYLLGRIRIKGVSLGAAGVFIVALLFGVMYMLFRMAMKYYRSTGS